MGSAGESIRRNTPNEVQCSMFCGGRRCKYESGNSWTKQDMALQVICRIQGLNTPINKGVK